MPDAMAASRSMFQREVGPEDSFLLSGDANLIDLRSVIQYRVIDALAYAYEVVDPDALVRATALAALRNVIAQRAIDAIYTTAREDIEREVSRRVQAKLDLYGAGIEVVTFRLLYVHPPDAVHDAFRDVASAQEDKLRTINRANIFAVEKVNQAKGEAAAKLEQALAARDQDIRHAQGDAAAFTRRLAAYREAPELTKYRLQLETIGAVLPGVQKIIRPGAGKVKDFDLWLLQPFASGGGRYAVSSRATGFGERGKRRRALVRTLAILGAACGLWALIASCFAVDVTEYAVVTRFGRVLRVISAPGFTSRCHSIASFGSTGGCFSLARPQPSFSVRTRKTSWSTVW